MFILASDHAGFLLKEKIKKYLTKKNIPFEDAGALSLDNKDDYPDYAKKASELVLKNKENKGIFICGTGIGMAIAANKVKGIRAVNVTSCKFTELAVKHNNANVITLAGRFTGLLKAKAIINTFLKTNFEGERHLVRIKKIEEIK